MLCFWLQKMVGTADGSSQTGKELKGKLALLSIQQENGLETQMIKVYSVCAYLCVCKYTYTHTPKFNFILCFDAVLCVYKFRNDRVILNIEKTSTRLLC